MGRVLLRVAHQFERDGPGLRNGDKGETALAKDCFAARHSGAGSRRRRSYLMCVLAGCDKVDNKIGAKASQRVGVMTHSSSQGSATSAWSFIQSTPRPNLRAASAGPEPLLLMGKTERAMRGFEGPVDVVDVLGTLVVGGQWGG